MPRYYFHSQDGVRVTDTDGTVLPDMDAARREAVEILCRLIHEKADDFWVTKTFLLTVTDATGLVLLTIDVEGTVAPVARHVSPLG